MEGRRVSSKNQKYNPLFILFLCLVAAVLVLLIISIVLGIRLGKANKELKEAKTQVEDLQKTVSQLEDDLTAAQSRASQSPAAGGKGSESGGSDAQPAGTSASSTSWLDLTGHNEVKVKPTDLLEGYATYYTSAGVNMRSGPATSYDRITTLDYGEKVQVAAREGNWSFVKAGSRFGWVSSDYLSTSEPAPQVTTNTTTTKTNTSTGNRSEATSGSLKKN